MGEIMFENGKLTPQGKRIIEEYLKIEGEEKQRTEFKKIRDDLKKRGINLTFEEYMEHEREMEKEK
jgi:hypothetical protein